MDMELMASLAALSPEELLQFLWQKEFHKKWECHLVQLLAIPFVSKMRLLQRQ
jgi:hypothetical protein